MYHNTVKLLFLRQVSSSNGFSHVETGRQGCGSGFSPRMDWIRIWSHTPDPAFSQGRDLDPFLRVGSGLCSRVGPGKSPDPQPCFRFSQRQTEAFSRILAPGIYCLEPWLLREAVKKVPPIVVRPLSPSPSLELSGHRNFFF